MAGRNARHLRRAAAAVVAFALIAALVVAVRAGDGVGDDRAVPARPTPSAAPPREKPASAVRDLFGILRRPARPEDRTAGAGGGAVRLVGRVRGTGFLVSATRRTLCLRRTAPQAGATCHTLQALRGGRRATGLVPDGRGPAAFVFRDGISTVRLQLADGTTLRRPVRDNAVVVDLPSPLIRIQWQSPTGGDEEQRFRRSQVTEPADAFPVLARAPRSGDQPPATRLRGTRFATAQGSTRMWLAADGGRLCLHVWGPKLGMEGCQADFGDPGRPLLAVWRRPDGRRRVAALAVHRAVARLDAVEVDGSVRPVPVRNGAALLADDGRRIDRLRLTIRDGGAHEVHLPRSAGQAVLNGLPR